MQIRKKGIRVLGIAESCPGRTYSTLAGVVMRKDLRIDGFTVGGMDATEAVTGMVRDLDRKDIHAVMISGAAIAWFNIIDLDRVSRETGLPAICVTYEESDGLADDIRYHFPEDGERLAAYARLGERVPVVLRTERMRCSSAGILPWTGKCRNLSG
jgi:endonuclease V-like protein UPF0215 family